MGKKKKVDLSGVEIPDLTGKELKPGYGIPFQPTVQPDFQEQAVQQREQEKYQEDNAPDLIDLPGLAIKDAWVESGLFRASERNADSRDFQDDPNFKITDEHLDTLPIQYDLDNRTYLKESTSKDDFAARQRWIDEDMKRKRELAAYGGKGVFASFAASLLDPAMLPLMAATGGESFLASSTRLGKVARAASSFGAQGAAMEGALVAGDTQKSGKDVLHGFVGGAVLGSAFGSLTRLSPKAALSAHISDGIDLALARDAEAILDTPTFLRKQAGEVVGPLPEGELRPTAAWERDPASNFDGNIESIADVNTQHPELANRRVRGTDANMPAEGNFGPTDAATHPPFKTVVDEHVTLDNQHIDSAIDMHRSNLEVMGSKDMGGRKGAALKKDLAAKAESIKADIAEMLDTLNNHRATVAAAMGAARNGEHATTIAFRMQGIENIYRPAMERAQAKLDSLTERLMLAKEARGSRDALKAFDGKSRVEQIHELFPDGPPKSRELRERHEFALDIVSDALAAKETERAAQLLDKLEPPEPSISLATGESLARETTPAQEAAKIAKEAERAAKVDALVERNTAGQTTKQFLKAIMEKAVQRGRVAKQWLPAQWLRDRLQGSFTTIDASQNQVFRGINFMTSEAAQGGFVPENTVSIYQNTYLNQIRTKEMNRWNEGFAAWSKDQGRGIVAATMDVGKHKHEFDTEVFLKIANPSREVHPGVEHAANGHREGLQFAKNLRQKNGEMGWENVKDDLNYVPIIFDSNGVVHHAANGGEARVRAVVSKAYQEGKFTLDAKTADRMAEMQVRRSMAHQLSGNQVFKNVVAESEVAGFIADLKKHGVPDDFIAGLLEERETDALMSNISNRAKFSLGLNPETELDGIRMTDLLYTDTPVLTQNYYRESAGGAAFAKVGFRSYEHYNRVINEAEEMGLKLGLDPKRNREEAEMLREVGKQLYGKPLDNNPDDLMKTTLRRGMSWITLRALNLLGFAQMPETGRAMSMFGAHEIMSNIPAVAIFRRKSARAGGVYSGELNHPQLRDVEFMLGYQGEDKLVAPLHIRGEEFQQVTDTAGDIGRILDNTLALGGNINNVASGFQATQGAAEKIVGLSIYKKLIRMAEGDMPFGSSRMTDEVGWTKEWFDKFKKFHNEHPLEADFNGEKHRLIDHEAMPVDMKDTFMLGMNRLRGRAIQMNYIGEASPWMDKWLGRSLVQFRRFSIISTEKQLIHDLRGDKIQAAHTLAWTSMISLMAYSARAHIKSMGQDDPQAYLDKAFTNEAVGYGVFNFLPQTAGVSLFAESFGAMGLIPDRYQAAPGRTGISSKYSPPVLSGITDGVKAIHSTVKALDGTGSAHNAARDSLRLMPFQGAVGVNWLTNKASNLLE